MSSTNTRYHTNLSNYFGGQPLFFDGYLQKKPNIRKCMELPCQQTKAEMWEDLVETLSDLHFIEAKCASGLLNDLEWDFRKILELANVRLTKPLTVRQIEVLSSFARFIKRTSHILTSDPGNVLQEAWNFEQEGCIARTAQQRMKLSESGNYLWVRRIFFPLFIEESPLKRTFISQDGYLRGLSVNTTGEFAAALFGKRSGSKRKHEGEGLVVEVFSLHEMRSLWKQLMTVNNLIFCQYEDKTYFLTSDKDFNIRIWEPRFGNCLQTLSNESGKITALASPDKGELFASGNENGKIHFWSLKTGKCHGTLPGHKKTVRNLSFTPKGDILVSTGEDNQMLVWDVHNQTLLGDFEWYTGKHEIYSISLSAIELSSDGQLLATGVKLGCEGTASSGIMANVRIWDIKTGRCLSVFKAHKDGVTCMAMSQNRRFLVTGGEDRTWKVWEVATGKCLLVRNVINRGTAIALTGDGRLALSAEYDHNIELWETETGRVLHKWNGSGLHINYISITADGSVGLIRSAEKILILNTMRGDMVYQGDSADSSCIFRITANTNKKLRYLRKFPLTPDKLDGWALNPDGRIAIRKGKGFLGKEFFEIWDIGKSGEKIVMSSMAWDTSCFYSFKLIGNLLLGVTADKNNKGSIIWDVFKKQPLIQLRNEVIQKTTFQLANESALFVTSDPFGILRIRKLYPPACIMTIPGHIDIGFEINEEDGTKKATRLDALADLPLLIDDTESGTVPHPFEIKLSRDSVLAEYISETRHRIYHVPSCRRLSMILEKNRYKEQLRISDDGLFAVTGGFDEPLGLDDTDFDKSRGHEMIVYFWKVRLWDRAKGTFIKEYTGLEEDIIFLRSDAKLQRVLTGYYSGTVKLWEFNKQIKGQAINDELEKWAISKDGQLLVRSNSGTPHFYDLLQHPDPGREIGLLRDWYPTAFDQLGITPMVVAWSKNSSLAVLSNWIPDDPDLGVFNLNTGQLKFRLKGHIHPAASILISEDGNFAYTGGNDNLMNIWDLTKGICINSIPMKDGWFRLIHIFKENEFLSESIPVNNNDTNWLKHWRIIIQNSFGAFSVIDASNGLKIRDLRRSTVIPEHPEGLLPDGFSMVARSGSSIWMVDIRSGEQIMEFNGHSDITEACAFDAVKNILISSQHAGDSRLWVWNMLSGHVMARISGHRDSINAIILSFDGRYAITGSADMTVKVWDLQKLMCVRTFYMDGPVVALSPVLANGVFSVNHTKSSFILQLSEGWPAEWEGLS